MRNKSFTISEFFSFGWRTFKQNAFFLIVLFLVTSVISSILPIANHWPWKMQANHSLIFSLVNLVISVCVNIVIINATLILAQGKKITFSDLFTALPRFFPFLGGNILYSLILFAGLILLIFPAIIWGLQFMFYGYFIIDQGKGPIKALKASSHITYGYKWKLLWFSILATLLNLAGLLCLGVGLLITLPITWLATARIYVTLKNRAVSELE